MSDVINAARLQGYNQGCAISKDALADLRLQNARLLSERDAAVRECGRLRSQLERLRGALLEYGEHTLMCERRQAAGSGCVCGLREAMGEP